ncbi:MAG TPA: sigma-70 family RNA polymerase sigma factor [Solirubrobacteraceae bacterium]|jgi:RNA polymerase sigma-70 factor (ECF subfamily)|nr:sigma-70 family RNA polymerase sigma factor [Solirubrobacteraceae bacterium]
MGSRGHGFLAAARRSADRRKLADEELMGLVRTGDGDAFEIIYDRHCDAAFSLAYRMCGRRATAEEVLQEAFLALWRTGGRYDRSRGSVRNWILRIVHNHAVDALRRGVVRERRLLHEEGAVERVAGSEDTAEWTLDRERAHEVRGALESLPKEQSRVLELAYFGGFTHIEIASMLQLPAGTVKGRMRLGLAKLRIAMATEEGIGR